MTGRSFGFEIQTGRQIDLDRADTALAGELDDTAGAWRACINCGSCAATCPAGMNGEFNFRRIHYKIRLSLRIDQDDYLSIRQCLLCGKCQLVCPRGIATRYLAIQVMKNYQKHAEGIPSL